MTIDERLERLVERHEALTESVEIYSPAMSRRYGKPLRRTA
jgi:hypothetical protein